MKIAAAVRSNHPERSSRDSRCNGARRRTAWMFLRLVVLAVLFLLPTASGAAPKNIVIVVIDDAGVERFSTYGNNTGVVQTPTIDSIADSGVRFDNFWAYPVCSPFRASLMTGVTPLDHGVSVVLGLNSSFGLNPEQMNIAHMLSTEGYRVEAYGKWHMGEGNYGPGVKQHPIDSGFDLFDGVLFNPTQAVDGTPDVTGYFGWERCSGTSDIPLTVTCQLETTYSTTYITDAGISCLKGSKPFLCYVSYQAAHVPYHNPPDELHDYDGQCIDEDPDPEIESWGPPNICHKAMVQALDTELARLDDAINFNTTTLFVVADNGTPEAAADGPYPANHNKGTVYQGGLNTPLIVKGKAVTVDPTIVDDIVQTTDIFATLAAIAGFDLAQIPEEDRPKDSVSLLPYLTGPVAAPLRNTVTAEIFRPTGLPAMPDASRKWLRSSRDECYKLLWSFDPSPFRDDFYNLCEDEFEEFPLDTSMLNPEEQDSYDALLVALRDPHLEDVDGDEIGHFEDNCIARHNPKQDDTDGDSCGNVCDADYDQDGWVGDLDYDEFLNWYGSESPLHNHTEPVTDVVGFSDFAVFGALFDAPPGPSGTTLGTLACP